MESDLPRITAAIRALLLTDATFVTASGSRIGTKAPSDVTVPYVTIQIPTPVGAMGGGGYKPIVQVDGWCAIDGTDAPEDAVWLIATRARRIFDTARNVAYQTMHYSARSLDFGSLPPDLSRGTSAPLAHAMARAELTIHNL